LKKSGRLVALVLAALPALAFIAFAASWFMPAVLEEERPFIVPEGASLTTIAHKLQDEGFIESADFFLIGAKIFGGSQPIKAGEFLVPTSASGGAVLSVLQSGDVIRRFVAIPEGLPSIMVQERLMAENLLTGNVAVPAEGSVLPDSYDFERGEARSDVLARMQAAMKEFLPEAWRKRTSRSVVRTPREAIILASIVEKETGKADERRMVAGVLSNRLRIGMALGADATTIYPITKGKPLGRQIRVSELRDRNPYNTRAIAGLPVGPITNPGRESILAVLDPAETDALYYVADGTGGHVFANTLEEHNANAAKWRQIRRERGEIE